MLSESEQCTDAEGDCESSYQSKRHLDNDSEDFDAYSFLAGLPPLVLVGAALILDCTLRFLTSLGYFWNARVKVEFLGDDFDLNTLQTRSLANLGR